MNYLLDTNICIYMLKHRSLSILKNAKSRGKTNIFISSITESELWYGAAKSSKQNETIKELDSFLSLFSKLDYDSSAAKLYGFLKSGQYKKGKILGNNDLMIAAQALDIDAVLVTDNDKEYKMVSDLRVENWLKH